MLKCPLCGEDLVFEDGDGKCSICYFGYAFTSNEEVALDKSLKIIESEVKLSTGEEGTIFTCGDLQPIAVSKEDLQSGVVTKEEVYQQLSVWSLEKERGEAIT